MPTLNSSYTFRSDSFRLRRAAAFGNPSQMRSVSTFLLSRASTGSRIFGEVRFERRPSTQVRSQELTL